MTNGLKLPPQDTFKLQSHSLDIFSHSYLKTIMIYNFAKFMKEHKSVH